MDWVNALSQGGGWTVAIFFGWCVGTGKLVLKREVDLRDTALTKIEATQEKTLLALDAAHEKERSSLQASNQSLEKRLEDIGGRFDRYLLERAGRES